MAKAKRSPKQIAATKRMQAAAKRARAAKKPATRATRPGSRPAAKAPAVNVTVKAQAPATKPASRAKRAASRGRASAGKAMKLGTELIHDVAIPAAVGAGGASINDVVFGLTRRFLPAAVTTGPAKHAVKAAAGVAMAMIAQKVGLPAKHAKCAAVGVVTVEASRLLTGLIESNTTLQLNGMGMTVGELAAVLPDDLNGLEALGALASGDAELGAVIPFVTDELQRLEA